MPDTVIAAAGAHPHREIADALTDCARAGLTVEEAPGRCTWGRVACPSRSRSLAVPLVSTAPGVHAKRIRVFLAEHRGHRAGQP